MALDFYTFKLKEARRRQARRPARLASCVRNSVPRGVRADVVCVRARVVLALAHYLTGDEVLH